MPLCKSSAYLIFHVLFHHSPLSLNSKIIHRKFFEVKNEKEPESVDGEHKNAKTERKGGPAACWRVSGSS